MSLLYYAILASKLLFGNYDYSNFETEMISEMLKQ